MSHSDPHARGGRGRSHIGPLDWFEAFVFRLLWFLPAASILRNLRFQHVVASRFLSDAAQEGIAYGAIVATIRSGGSAIEVAVIGIARLLPPVVFGVYGGAIADALPKRAALGLGYLLQAAFCLTLPWLIGTDTWAVALLILLIHSAGQVSGPAESAIVPVVVPESRLAQAGSLLSFAGAAGIAFGTVVLAPAFVKLAGVPTLIVVAGVMLLVAATRLVHLPSEKRAERIRVKGRGIGPRAAVRWSLDHPATATLIVLAALVGALNAIFTTLGPEYVESTLGADAADSVYVFAPSAIGIIAALVFGPSMIHRFGERLVTLAGAVLVAVPLSLLGVVGPFAALLGPINPLQLVRLAGINPGDELLAAGLLAVPIGFGVTAAAAAVTLYIQRHVPASSHGRVFATRSTLTNLVGIAPLLVLGFIAPVLGSQIMLLIAPVLLVVTLALLVNLSYRIVDRSKGGRLTTLRTYLYESPAGVLREP